MKKYLIVLAALAMILVSCKDKKQEATEYTKISFKQTELTLGVGATAKLTVLYEPTTLDAPACTWTTSDASIVSVNNGNIEALEIGEANITAKVGELSAVCHIIVKDPYELFEWGAWTIWDINKTDILSNDTLVTKLTNGQTVHCVMISCTYAIWDSNIVLDEEAGDITGTGYWVDAPGTIWLITEDMGKGENYHILWTGRLDVVDYDKFDMNDTTYAGCIPAGKLGDAQVHAEWLQDETSKLEDITEIMGSRIDAISWDGSSGKYEGYFLGLLGEGIFLEYSTDEETTEYLYRTNVNWWLGDDVAYGLKFVYNESEDKWEIKEPAEWGELSPYYYEYLGPLAQQAPKYTAKEPFMSKNANKINKEAMPNNVLIKK